MRSNIHFTSICLIVSILISCSKRQDKQAIIDGKIDFYKSQFIHISRLLPTGIHRVDSATTDENGYFSFRIPCRQSQLLLIGNGKRNFIALVCNPGDTIRLKASGSMSMPEFDVEGSEESQWLSAYFMYTAFNQSRVDSLSVQYAASRSKADFTSIKSKLDNAYLEIFNDQKSWVSNFINKHLQSLASVFVINQRFGPNILLSETSEPELFVRLDSALHTKFTDNPLVTDFHERTKLLKSLINSRKAAAMCISAGIKAPEIVLHDASGKMQKLSSTKGKLTLVYFWAAWNAMSRKSNLELLLLYNELNNKGFEIFAISLDSDFEMWEKAWRLDKAFWRQLHDPDGFNSAYCRLYGVQSLPTFILIGRDGRVISATNSLNDIKTLINNNI